MKKKKKISKLFAWIFFPPVVLWTFIGLIAIIPDDTIPPEEMLTFGDFVLASAMLIIPWFIICIIITKIFYYLKKKIRKEIKCEKKSIEKKEEKITTDVLKIKNNEEEKTTIKTNLNNKETHDNLYEIDSYINSHEYAKLANYFPQIYFRLTISTLIANLLIAILIAIIFKDIMLGIVFFIIPGVYCLIERKVNIQKYAEKDYNEQQKKYGFDEKFILKFYNDYFKRISDNVSYKIKYNEITKCIETDKNIYLYWKNQNKVINLLKDKCNKELIEFIYTKVNSENIDKKNKISKKNNKNSKFIKKLMLILFILTLCSLFISSKIINYVNKLNNVHGFEFTKSAWIYWCFLPIPILSIILGFKYNGKGLKCSKNIVSGFIMGILLLIYGAFSLFPTYSEDYNKIYEYKEIISVNIPNNGDLEIIEWGTYFGQDKTEYVVINAYYDEEDTSNLETEIKNSNNWFLSKNSNSDLKIFIPITFVEKDNEYYLIYNKTLNEYNKIPSTSGNYECYVMRYNTSEKIMEIHKFKFNYIKEDDLSNSEKQFKGKIVEINDNTIIVEPEENTLERKSSDKIIIKEVYNEYVVIGDKVLITYNGLIEESYPAQISANKIEVIK